MKKLFVVLSLLAAFALAANVVTVPLLASTQHQVENSDIENVSGDTALIAAVLSIILPGLGQMYVGKVTRGIMILGSFIALYIIDIVALMILGNISSTLSSLVGCIFSIVILAFWIWQILDAYKLGQSGGGASFDPDDEDDDDAFVPFVRPVSGLSY